jgi:hypothetical protein
VVGAEDAELGGQDFAEPRLGFGELALLGEYPRDLTPGGEQERVIRAQGLYFCIEYFSKSAFGLG